MNYFKRKLESYLYINITVTYETPDRSENNLQVKLFDYMSKKDFIRLYGVETETLVNKSHLTISPGNKLKAYDLKTAATLSEKIGIAVLKLIANRILRIVILFTLLILLTHSFLLKIALFNAILSHLKF